ncbi:MAG: sigma 54-interacting transcriptional regulator [Candidatus Anammoxibacter sp.]
MNSIDTLKIISEEKLDCSTKSSNHDKPLVMVVDDNESIRQTLKYILEDEGYAIQLAHNGQTAIDNFSKDIYAVILDIVMPDINGFEVFEKLKSKNPYCPIIFQTGFVDEQNRDDIRKKFRPYAYVIKGQDPEQLLDTLAGAVEYYKNFQENMKLNHELNVLNQELTLKTDDLSKANLNIQNFNLTLTETVEKQIKEIARKEEILARIIEIGKFINSSLDLNKTLVMVMKISKSMMNAEACSIILFNKSVDNIAHKVILKKGGKTSKQSFELNEEKGIIKWAIEHKESIIIDDAYNDKRLYKKYDEIPGFTTKTMLCIPLKVKEGILGVAQVINKRDGEMFQKNDKDIFSILCAQIALAVKNAGLFEELNRAKEIKENENIMLRNRLKKKNESENIIAKSQKANELIEIVKKVTDAPYSVLITGESGTGKELVAKTIHYNGIRRDSPFCTLNCAAVPKDLIESELFGHEKGAFTGAIQQKLGLFELSNNGSLFLDEIGDMSLHAQAKILRVLQEKELQRVGGTELIKVNVRVLAATNKDLLLEIKNGNFREDLYYRLNVVSIHTPPLRERREDIPLLVNHFLKGCNSDMNKHIPELSSNIMDIFMNYNWPGNIRELKNMIERIVTLSPDNCLEISEEVLPAEMCSSRQNKDYKKYKTIGSMYLAQKQLEKEMISEALEKTQNNKSRAAGLLGISRKVLYEKMQSHELNNLVL